MPIKEFHIDVTLENGQLHESLSEADTEEMIKRLDGILSMTTPGTTPELRAGVIQILIDQLTNNAGHPPIIIRTGLKDADEERLVWHCKHAKIKVKVEKYRKTDRTPHQSGVDKLFKFTSGDENFDVNSTEYDKKDDAIKQRFFKFTIKGKDKMKPDPNDLELDPCIICER